MLYTAQNLARPLLADLRCVRESERTFALYRGNARCGAIWLREDFSDEPSNGWYARRIYEGREQRTRKPCPTPQEAALKIFGTPGRDAVRDLIAKE